METLFERFETEFYNGTLIVVKTTMNFVNTPEDNYSTHILMKKIRGIMFNLSSHNRLTPMRNIIRGTWLFYQLYKLYEKYLPLISKIPSFVKFAFSTGIEILDSNKIEFDKRMVKYIDNTMEIVIRVHEKIREMIARDTNNIKILPPGLLARFVRDATPWMISKIQCLPWIEPDVVLMATPGYNYYWSNFWLTILNRNFNFNYDICLIIAEYMPMPLRGETFLDLFRRKFNKPENRVNNRIVIVF